jgi:hypothetical protein
MTAMARNADTNRALGIPNRIRVDRFMSPLTMTAIPPTQTFFPRSETDPFQLRRSSGLDPPRNAKAPHRRSDRGLVP